MKTFSAFLLVATAGLFGCATTVPTELASARQAYHHASNSAAAKWNPADLHKAHVALTVAEQSFASDPDGYHTRDLAYVAQRKAEMAEWLARISIEQDSRKQSNADYQSTQSQIIKDTKGDLSRAKGDLRQSRSDLNEAERNGQKAADQLAVEKRARADADQRASAAQEALARLAAVKQETRGMVITLSGSVLFASDKAVLLPDAMVRLGQVAEAMLATGDRIAVVEGHTDSRGSDSHNVDLSQRRADAVRHFLIARGYDSDRISAHGIGKDRPVADNRSAEGRANNRRVEIIVEPEKKISTN